MRLVLAPFFRLLFRPRFAGRENMPQGGPCFIIGNHSQTFDGFLVNMEFFSEPTTAILTEEYFRGGLISWLFRQMGLVSTRKFQPQATPVREIMRLVKDNRMIVIMPEGERNWDGITQPTIASTGKLFRRLGIPVHPVITHNGYLSWPRWAHWPRWIQVTIEFKPPLDFTPEMSDDEVARMVDESILWSPDRDLPDYPPNKVRGYRPADGISKLIFRCPSCGDDEDLQEKRGRYLLCEGCGSSWRVGGDSYLTDQVTSVRRSSTTIFRHICQMPREVRDFGEHGKALLRARNLPVYLETDSPKQTLLGRYTCLLREDRVELVPESDGQPVEISLAGIQTMSIEKKYKLQLRTTAGLYQINFIRGSALQWSFYLKNMIPALGASLYRRENNPCVAVPILDQID